MTLSFDGEQGKVKNDLNKGFEVPAATLSSGARKVSLNDDTEKAAPPVVKPEDDSRRTSAGTSSRPNWVKRL
eukprot:CAMPEP_0169424336 /NCGR_PEP_ID=MMETSP1017-20121227/67979_1 /TAXON_ID=342587 /ORGANISM="Karlodinium micrum, Strain CCMP2283" /LENGTH=71 /DNA_ID=CAMNT_0009534099 /DNA_START=23 /DNA_END=235 /DNA_ORIENTATION=-